MQNQKIIDEMIKKEKEKEKEIQFLKWREKVIAAILKLKLEKSQMAKMYDMAYLKNTKKILKKN